MHVALIAVKVLQGDQIKRERELWNICLMQPIEMTLVILERERKIERKQQIELGLLETSQSD